VNKTQHIALRLNERRKENEEILWLGSFAELSKGCDISFKLAPNSPTTRGVVHLVSMKRTPIFRVCVKFTFKLEPFLAENTSAKALL
jgi:hypothetical protein